MTQIQQPPAAHPYAPQPYAPPQYGGFPPPQKKKRTGVIVGSVAAGVVTLGGLGVGALFLFGTETLDTAAVEAEISQLTADVTGVAATDVECPSGVEPEAGGTFSCTAVLDGQGTSFSVTQTDDEGNVEITSDDTYVVIADVEAFLYDEAVAQNEEGTPIDISCDTENAVIVGGLTEPLLCTASDTDTGDYVELLVTVADDGTVTYEAA
ncbi:DUF4333 domain-containing protein [Blastococcus sp. SYSU D00813]